MLFLALTSSLVTLRCRRLLFSPLFFVVVALYVILITVMCLDFWNFNVALSLRIWSVLCEFLPNAVYQKLFFKSTDSGKADIFRNVFQFLHGCLMQVIQIDFIILIGLIIQHIRFCC